MHRPKAEGGLWKTQVEKHSGKLLLRYFPSVGKIIKLFFIENIEA